MLSRSDLHDYQTGQAIPHILEHDRCSVWMDVGGGKSVTTLTALDDLALVEDGIWPALIIGTKRIARSVWGPETEAWAHLAHLKCSAILGTQDERRAALRVKADFYTINYENLGWLVDLLGDDWPFKTVVADECFVAGTQVRTPVGDVSIETLVAGDMVETHIGPRPITHVFTSCTNPLNLVSLKLSNGTMVHATQTHPFLTTAGWLPAALSEGHDLVCDSDLHDLSEALRAAGSQGPRTSEDRARAVLLPRMSNQAYVSDETRNARIESRKHVQNQRWSRGFLELWGAMVRCPSGGDVSPEERTPFPGRARGQREGSESDGSNDYSTCSGGLRLELDRTVGRLWSGLSVALQTRLRESEGEGLPGGRRTRAQFLQKTGSGRSKDAPIRVLGVEGFSNHQRQSVVPVFNIEVDGAPTYFANGALVHNCTRLKSFRLRQGGKNSGALGKVAHTKVRRFIGLTGTPASNGLKDLWGPSWFMDKGARLGRTYSEFEARWFTKGWDGYSVQPMPHAQKEIQDRLRDICLTVDVPAVDEPIKNDIYVDLPPTARRIYDEMERKMYAEIEEIGVERFSAAAKSSACEQLANGAIYVDDDHNWKPVHDAKLEALEGIVTESAGSPILVGYQFKHDLARLQRAFPKGIVLDDKTSTIDRWNAEMIELLFVHEQSAGHGLNLAKGGHILARAGFTWDLEGYDQIIGRIAPRRQKQAGLNRPVFDHRILARNTVDELKRDRISSKRSVQDILKEALRRRKGK